MALRRLVPRAPVNKTLLRQLRRRYGHAHPVEQDIQDIQTFCDRLSRDDPRDHTLLSRLVQHDLGLAYPWLPPVLRCQFRLWAFEAATGEALRLGVRPPELITLPPGRAPAHADRLAEYVRWFYRHELKQPPDTIASLAAEYTRGETRSDAHSEIQFGIARAKQLLDAIVLIDPT